MSISMRQQNHKPFNFKKSISVIAMILALSPTALMFQNCGEAFSAVDAKDSLSSRGIDDSDPTEIQSTLLGLTAFSTATKQGSDVIFTFKLAVAKTADITIDITPVDGTALNGIDYTLAPSSLTISPGSLTAALNVPTKDVVPNFVAKKFSLTLQLRFNANEENLAIEGLINPAYKYVTYKKIAIGGNHTCALTSDQTVQCWSSSGGLLGRNSQIASLVPVDVPGLTGIKDIATGLQSSCALTATNTVKCWGYNNINSDPNNSRIYQVPTDIPNLSNVESIKATLFQTCAIVVGGSVKCWGSFFNGMSSESPIDLGVSGIKAIAVGEYHVCMVTGQDTVKCWGSNSNGQLGNNLTTDSSIVVDALGLAGLKIKAVSAGFAHSCAVTEQGEVWCWGINGVGQLGNNTTIDSLVPVKVLTANNTALNGITAIDSSPDGHNCAITLQNTLYCWGRNNVGQIGNGAMINSLIALPVPGLAGVQSISAAKNSFFGSTCAINTNGLTKCWGGNRHGRAWQQQSCRLPYRRRRNAIGD